MITCADLIAKRKKIWNERHDIEYDTKYIKAAAQKILQTPNLRDEIYEKPYLLIEILFQIVNKQKKTVPFFLNRVQKDFISKFEQYGTTKPYYILKGRQQGITSLITAMQMCFAIVRPNFSGFTLADRDDNTRSIFTDKAKVPLKLLPDEFRPTEKANNAYELMFGKLNSSWRIATASNQVGRSRTLNFVHYSEIAFYQCAMSSLQSSIGEATVAGAVVIYETTANGFNEAKELWDAGSCNNLFYEWWWSDEYRCNEYQYLETNDAWLKNRLAVLAERGLDKEQLAWYARKYDTYIDKQLIKQEYPCSAEEAFISSGYSLFDKDVLQDRLTALGGKTIGKRGIFEYDKTITPIYDSENNVVGTINRLDNIKFSERQDGYIVLHAEPRVLMKNDVVVGLCPYVVGGDTAGSGQDYFTAKVIDNLNGDSVATLRVQRIDEDVYAEQVLCLGYYYHEALIAIETNYSRHPTNVITGVYGYTNFYMRERMDRIGKQVENVYGFETNTKTKPIIIAELVKFIRDNPNCENDVETLKEMTTFVKKDNGKLEAIEGAHDDLVMADAIAHFCGNQQGSKTWLEVKQITDDFIDNNFSINEEQGENHVIDWDDF